MMPQLTPIEETVIGRELIEIGKQRGRQEGEKQGLTKGELIGEIRATQKFLKRPVMPVEELSRQTMPELKTLLRILEAELAALN